MTIVKRRICDPHIHIYPSGAATNNLRRVLYGENGFQIPSSHLTDLPGEFTAKAYLEHARPHGVRLAVNLPVANRGKKAAGVAAINEWCLGQHEESCGQVRSLGAINPTTMSQVEIAGELDRIKRSKLISGVKLIPMAGPAFQEFDPADCRLEPFYKAVADRDMMIVWHMGSRMKDPVNVATAKKIADIYERYAGRIRMVAAHLGNDAWEEVRVHLIGLEGIAFDLAYVYPMETEYPYIVRTNGATFRRVISDVGTGRTFGGYDFPHMSVGVGQGAFDPWP